MNHRLPAALTVVAFAVLVAGCGQESNKAADAPKKAATESAKAPDEPAKAPEAVVSSICFVYVAHRRRGWAPSTTRTPRDEKRGRQLHEFSRTFPRCRRRRVIRDSRKGCRSSSRRDSAT